MVFNIRAKTHAYKVEAKADTGDCWGSKIQVAGQGLFVPPKA